MRKFLSQFLSATQIDEIEKAFKEKNPDSNGLPTYIAKSRLDEEINKRKAAEDVSKNFESEKAKAVKEAEEKLAGEWKTKLDAAMAETTKVKTEYEGKLASAQKSAEVSAKIYESGARNVKAVRALLDDTKPIDEQLKALKESDSYLFNSRSGLGKGTGKGDDDHGGDGDDGAGKDDGKIAVSKMYEAVGIPAPEQK